MNLKVNYLSHLIFIQMTKKKLFTGNETRNLILGVKNTKLYDIYDIDIYDKFVPIFTL